MHVAILGLGRVGAGSHAAAALDGDDGALGKEGVGNAHGLVEEAAGVAAQVKHDALDAACGLAFAASLGEGVLELVRGLLGEAREADPVVAVFEALALDADQRDGVAHDAHGHRLLLPGVQDGQLDGRALGPADAGDDFLQGEFLGGLAVDGEDDVAGLHAGLEGGRVLDGGDDRHLAVLHGNFDAYAEELARGGLLHLLVLLRVHERGVGVEPLEHALDGAVDQILLAHVLDVGMLDDVEHLAEAAQGLELAEGRRDGLLVALLDLGAVFGTVLGAAFRSPLGVLGARLAMLAARIGRGGLDCAGTHAAAAARREHQSADDSAEKCTHERLPPISKTPGTVPFFPFDCNGPRLREPRGAIWQQPCGAMPTGAQKEPGGRASLIVESRPATRKKWRACALSRR